MKKYPVLVSLLVGIGLFLEAHAEETFVPHVVVTPIHPCQLDAEKFCKDVEPGRGRLRKCLKKHKSEISEECWAKVKAAKKQFKNLKKICNKDIKSYCTIGFDKEHGSLIHCLTQHQNLISKNCREECRKKF